MHKTATSGKLLGLVLCGGQSKRMGTDKGMIQGKAESWAQETAAKLINTGLGAVYSINTLQIITYSAEISSTLLICDSLELPGPLNGILSAHQRYPDTDLFVLACDMPLMNVATLNRLAEAYKNKPKYGVYFYEKKGFKEPLCSIFRKETLASLLQAYISAELTQYSLQKILSRLPYLALEMVDTLAFSNINSAEEL